MELRYFFGKDGEEEFFYEIDDDDIIEMAELFYPQMYDCSVDGARSIIAGLISDGLLNYESDDEFVDFLKEQFEDDAREAYKDYCEYRDYGPYAYYGVSESDFH